MNLNDDSGVDTELFETKNDEDNDDVFFKDSIDDDFFFKGEIKDSDLEIDNNKDDEEFFAREKIQDNKLPNVSIDEYMRNFDEIGYGDNEVSSLFSDDDMFPNIPI